ncbi:hypothetical protein ACQEVB_00720 [Pseudonocardia sp. CA-107938]|uniref:hypothetical protein n=1 Tax=Pseudonocardia sp. CA-107938 TaxID=3240021 RepID=UPI003D9508D5
MSRIAATSTAARIARRTAQGALGLVIAAAAMAATGTAYADAPPDAPVAPVAAADADLTITGDITGPITDASATCHDFGNGAYGFELKGLVNGAPVTLTFDTAFFKGAHTYNATGITDDDGGLVTLQTDQVQVVTNGASSGTFTIDKGELTGSIDTDLSNDGLTAHINGTWSCTTS